MALDNVVGEAAIQENLKQFLLVLSVSLSVATLSRAFTQFREIPYTLLLVIVGLFLALLDVRLISLPPQVTLFVFLPPLLFRTAWNVDWLFLKRDLVPILLYSTVGVLITVAGITLALQQFAEFPVTIALLAGASLAATSPAPIMSLLRQLGVKKRLITLSEGEDLFNSAVAIAAFTLFMSFPADLGQLNFPIMLARILTLGGIGLAVGGSLGLGISYLMQRSDLRFVGRSLLLVSSYGTYLLSEQLGGSGVVAVVTTGLILGTLGAEGIEPQKREVLTEFLNFIAFFVNSIVFLLIGDQINFANLGNHLAPIGIGIATVMLTRAIAIYGLGSLSNWLAGSQISLREQTLLWWTGLRGSVSVALALSVPIVLAQRQIIEATVFGVILFTLLVQGLTTKRLIGRLGFLQEESQQHAASHQQQQEYLQAVAHSVALNQILNHLDEKQVVSRGSSEPNFPHYRNLVQNKLNCLQEEIAQQQKQNPQLQTIVSEQLQKELIAMETGTYAAFVQAGFLSAPPPLVLPEVLQDGKDASD
ncbi:MAG: sodium:proton antiporter [Cyanobacteria bacterium QH_6_48_35]|jgi:CPA1 family monovalent cation:H+ antiporter|nr:MAG: sodium:proton antiporter [Cyanobacteria bacterium QH_1_48_107]PSO54927.1 MAG: sodium:proton antiporter [Cyanobacteria bacterium QH_10_48_56]PSO60196.1 MAG: sodium:proton antiporter [Cyanobacteria bacterium QH_7_48_89]PSO66548.1 MAG: sodium:proton antiporter [Cyanobacteria bacterium QH_6_48_35]PSO67117.1 MAG: sodium:proton antiporter [Cyanobacteria bacterium QS_1_48_34]PSO75097.1 MAG: sodium:proton antiporter [Cyanobacteria bacterium QH_3_48_40]PSO76886.1 MAG: sodium:proton antiporter 